MLKASIIRRARLLGTALLMSLPASAPANVGAEPQPLASIRAAAEEQVRSQLHGVLYTLHTQAVDLDPRLHFARCPGELVTSQIGSQPAARVTVRVSCGTGGVHWTVFVPVSVESEIPVLVLRQSALRGARVAADAVSTETRRVPGLATDYVSDVTLLTRRTLARNVPAGTALTAELLQADCIVHQGQAVTLVASLPGIEVRAPAKALEDGREGARVRVQNLASLKVVQGVVDASGLIYITP